MAQRGVFRGNLVTTWCGGWGFSGNGGDVGSEGAGDTDRSDAGAAFLLQADPMQLQAGAAPPPPRCRRRHRLDVTASTSPPWSRRTPMRRSVTTAPARRHLSTDCIAAGSIRGRDGQSEFFRLARNHRDGQPRNSPRRVGLELIRRIRRIADKFFDCRKTCHTLFGVCHVLAAVFRDF